MLNNEQKVKECDPSEPDTAQGLHSNNIVWYIKNIAHFYAVQSIKGRSWKSLTKKMYKAPKGCTAWKDFIILAFIALMCAGATQVSGSTILGMTQQHFFFDPTSLSLIAIVLFLDALVHTKIYRQCKLGGKPFERNGYG